MRLASFIVENIEEILEQWERFARSLPQGHTLSVDALRDDAEYMLRFVAADIESDQTRLQEINKAHGGGPAPRPEHPSAAQEHGVARALDRFSLIDVIAEYRALRASVTRMWTDTVPVTKESVAQLVRFNEAIDQILAEGVAKFTERLDYEADLFIASVGHDLRNPLNAVSLSAQQLMRSRSLSESERAAVARVERASTRLTTLLDDLRDYSRTRLGGLIKLHRAPCDVGDLLRDVVRELEPLHADRTVTVRCASDLVAEVDPKNLSVNYVDA